MRLDRVVEYNKHTFDCKYIQDESTLSEQRRSADDIDSTTEQRAAHAGSAEQCLP